MTDSIDLDEITTETDEPEEEPDNGDWFWRGEGDPDAESDASSAGSGDVDADGDAAADDRTAATPHVPRENRDKPVGIPTESGGAGGTSARAAADDNEPASASEGASGPHGGGADEMTLAFTYEAAKRFDDPGFVFASAAWADWIGIVGEVPAHVINNFQRNEGIDADFFNGSGTGPGERLAEITEMSMFFAERMAVVGCDGEEWIAEEAGWEFVPLETAAEKADWKYD